VGSRGTAARIGAVLVVAGGAIAFAVCSTSELPHGTDTPRSAGSTGRPAFPTHKIDAHVHLAVGGERRLLELMERYGFDHAVDLSGGTPTRGLAAHLAVANRLAGKITVFTTLAYEEVRAPGYGARMAEQVEAAHAAGARGLKIAKALGLGMMRPDGSGVVPVDDPELDVVFETAGRLGMPVAIHTGDPRAFWDPPDAKNERLQELSVHPGWLNYGKPVPSFRELADQFERRVARHPRTTFIGVHFGNDAEEPERVLRMLRAYPNLYVDLAARIPELGRHPAERLRQIFIEMQDRILYGTDLGVGPPGEPLMLGSSGADPPTPDEERLFFSATTRWLETDDRAFAHPTPIQGSWTIDGLGLPREVLEKIYWKNAARVIGITMD